MAEQHSQSNTPESVLRRYWKYPSFRPLQREIIAQPLTGCDAVALLPTGGGKSICFQVPAMMLDGVAIVVSPLVALMTDQVNQLKARGIAAEAVHSGKSRREIDQILDNCIYGNVKLLYLSPERLHTDLAKERIKRMRVSLIAVDEAHCISQWGYDFRPAYLEIPVIREWHPEVPILALTATATPRVAQDIVDKLELRDARLVRGSFHRENLSINVIQSEDKFRRLVAAVKKMKGKTSLIYVRSRRKTIELVLALRDAGVNAAAYHAGMSHSERQKIQNQWVEAEVPVVVATTAFGMGIDKPDVRMVVHYDLPPSLEEYYQEAGRAGRDGHDSFCLVLTQHADRARLEDSWEKAYPTTAAMRRVYTAVMSYLHIPVGSGKGKQFPFDLPVFCKMYRLNGLVAYQCMKAIEREGWWIMNEGLRNPSKVKIRTSKEALYQYQMDRPDHDVILKVLLRGYEGMFLEPVTIDEAKCARAAGCSPAQLRNALVKMDEQGVVTYQAASELPQVILLEDRVVEKNLDFDEEHVASLRKRARERIDAVFGFLDATTCREHVLLEYFGETMEEFCGRCDLCRADKQSVTAEMVIEKLRSEEYTLKEFIDAFDPADQAFVRRSLVNLELEEVLSIEGDTIRLHKSRLP